MQAGHFHSENTYFVADNGIIRNIYTRANPCEDSRSQLLRHGRSDNDWDRLVSLVSIVGLRQC